MNENESTTLPMCNASWCPEDGEHLITTGRCVLVPAAPVTAPLPPDPAVSRVADWLAKEYGELLDRDPPGYWEFQARELLDVVADTTAGEAMPVCPDCPSVGGRCAICPRTGLPPLAARSGGAQDDGLRDALLRHHPIAHSDTGVLKGCRCGGVGLGQDVIAHVAAELRRALAGPNDARQDGAG